MGSQGDNLSNDVRRVQAVWEVEGFGWHDGDSDAGIQFIDTLAWMAMGDNRPRRTPSRSSS
ncbi:hypothetical protein CY34DRAFT_802063 [Suillus luteus UH-Slu-Lm8-n1]|uniref:Uncharacterized protein n=1 Tax=Suillus luteus UH-Slu-Lm8-n1 TaxID=930992 RepID=A0A0D0A4I6_9AGAM|nr:hypothetical protein CY34DRAFT_802063 [Suillus luteus UH-Slu-Lm8-n1]